MKIITNIAQMHACSAKLRGEGKTIGFVPTMGYLHDGHLSLFQRARKENDYLVISIFVNPAQFGPREDFQQYPRDLSRDKRLARAAGVNLLFLPRIKQIYPPGHSTFVDVQGLGGVLCAVSRPNHFRGVATIVLKLLNIVTPDKVYFGQKDAQQALIIKRMSSDLNLKLKIKVLPIVREPDGLAMSSRNTYLSKRQRSDAVILYKSLQTAVGMINSGYKNPRKIIARMHKLISAKASARIEYIKIVELQNLQEVRIINNKALIALAVYFGKTRLIDNAIV